MYNLFRNPPLRPSKPYAYPGMENLKHRYLRLQARLLEYYHQYPKYVLQSSPLGGILKHIPLRPDLDNYLFCRFVDSISQPLVKAFGFVDSNSKGRIFTRGVSLGNYTKEVIISDYREFDTNSDWRQWIAFDYMYHTRVIMDMPVMANDCQGRGWGIGKLNIPMLALQYRCWLNRYSEYAGGVLANDPVNRFIGSYVFPHATESFTDIAFFNRLADIDQYPYVESRAHPFDYVMPSGLSDRLAGMVNSMAKHRSRDIEQLAYSTPLLFQYNLFYQLRDNIVPVTRQNEWAIILSKTPYLLYLVNKVREANSTDRSYLNKIKIAIQEARWDNIAATVPDYEIREIYSNLVNKLLRLTS